MSARRKLDVAGFLEKSGGRKASKPLSVRKEWQAFPGTTFGRLVLGENWKLSGLPVMMLNGRPEAISRIGAKVQLLKKLAGEARCRKAFRSDTRR